MTGNDMGDDERLRALLHDAVSDVQPHDGLGEVRRRTRARRTSSRRWAPLLVGAGAVAATVVVATVVVAGVNSDPDSDEEPPVASTSTSGSTSDPTTAAAGLYFVSNTATGPRLFREFQAVTPTDDPEQKVLTALQRLTLEPRDPDYVTLWPAESFDTVRIEDDRVVVELGTTDALEGAAGDGRFGVQQAVYTAEAALGDRLPVSFELDDEPARRVLGLDVGTLVARDTSFTLTAPVNITDPSEGLLVEDGALSANGTMSTNVRRVEWTLSLDGDSVRQGRATPADVEGPDAQATLHAPGWVTGEIDVSDLAPGEYVFEVTALDVGQTSDAPAEFSDTRTISIR
ncbi:GerMN domain-containing protein [Nocardioides bizhenqiangii]|uniref:GerMN domain-containing protein n=1 Tax=Nocardioides bizhenqiangii TaxID=3095076 RepID=A0ABZ0ZV76_9ACTN|nr:GerMN domain-containing protein [Nocardioides sp. HM61]WQQ28205.1 GerMN domain-containing protein [Nocardioides sp. HM61]